MKKKLNNGLFLIAALLLWSIMCTDAFANDILPMPKGLEGVYLGMSLDDLKKVKPSIKKDDWSYSALYFEKDINNEFFDATSYEFLDNKLVVITLAESGTFDWVKNRIPGLIKGSAKKWGNNYSKKVGVIENDPITKMTHLFPIFYWEKPQGKIIMDYIVTVDKKFAPNGYTIKIYNSRFDLNNVLKVKLKDDSTPQELEMLFKDVKIAEIFEGIIFE